MRLFLIALGMVVNKQERVASRQFLKIAPAPSQIDGAFQSCAQNTVAVSSLIGTEAAKNAVLFWYAASV